MAAKKLVADLFESGGLDCGAGKGRVDVANGVIHNVRVLGWQSKRGYRYRPEGVSPHLYEGAPVYLGHKPPGTDRAVSETVGWLSGIRRDSDGLRGDLHLCDPTGPEERRILSMAQHNPRLLALSHSAKAGRWNSTRTIVESVEAVESVDLVRRGATNETLFENDPGGSMSPKLQRLAWLKRTHRRMVESARADLSRMGRRRALKWLREEGEEMMADAMGQAADAGTNHQDAFLDGIKRAISACLEDDSLSWEDRITTINAYLKSAKKHASGDEDAESESTAGKGDMDEPAGTPGARSGIPGLEGQEGYRSKRYSHKLTLQEKLPGPRGVVLGGRRGLSSPRQSRGESVERTLAEVPDPRDRKAMARFLRTGR